MRSLLLVPGDGADRFDAALRSGADALVIDLEAVAPPAREAARRSALGFLRGAGPRRPRFLVRVGALGTGLAEDDLAAVMPGGPDGIVLSGAVGGADVQRLGARLAVWEAEFGLIDGATRILPEVGTARGALAAAALAGSSPRLMGVAWGAERLAADLGAETGGGEDDAHAEPEPCRLARSMVLLAAAGAGVAAVDAAHPASHDPAGLERECRAARRDGFAAKMALHPAQVPAINAAFASPPGAPIPAGCRPS